MNFFSSILGSKTEEPKAQPETDTKNSGERSGLWSSLQSKLGSDVTVGLSLPIWLNEPSTMLTRMAEMLHFSEILDEASRLENSLDRLAYAAVFAITGYNGTERYGKPFDSYLGETFEYVNEKTGIKFISEMVCKEPPTSAAHAENENFVWYQYSRPKSKFNGNSVDLDPSGKSHIYFPRTREHIVYTAPPTKVYNLIIGSSWIDHVGTLSLTNLKTNETCSVTFEPCGWMNANRYAIHGAVKNAQGQECILISGKWNESVNLKWNYEGGKEPKGTNVTVWKRPGQNSFGKHNMTDFAIDMLKLDAESKKMLPPTDARLRPDRYHYELENNDLASAARSKLEEKQRADFRARIAKGEEWTPRWFKEIKEEKGDSSWIYSGDYWEQRALKKQWLEQQVLIQAMEKLALQPDAAAEQTQTLPPAPLLKEPMADGIRGLVCDFPRWNS